VQAGPTSERGMNEPALSPRAIRYCKDCGRQASHAGDACAFCGGSLAARPQPTVNGPVERNHPQIVAATVTFCLGLLLVRALMALWMSDRYRPASVGSDPLLLLEIFSACGTLLFLVLRGEEGDFRALFLVTVLLFIGEEVLSSIALIFGPVQIRVLSTVMAFATSIFGSLAVIADAYDGQAAASQATRRTLRVTTWCLLLLAGAQAASPMLINKESSRVLELAGIAALLALLAYLAMRLFLPFSGTASSPQLPPRGGIGPADTQLPARPATPPPDSGERPA